MNRKNNGVKKKNSYKVKIKSKLSGRGVIRDGECMFRAEESIIIANQDL